MYQEYAKAALGLIAQSGVKCDDRSLALATAVREMLHGIANGTLVIGTPIPDPPKETP